VINVRRKELTNSKKYDIIEITKKFSDRIRELVQSYDMPPKIMADNMDVSYSTLKRVMSYSKSKFNVYVIDRICCYFKLELQELIGMKEIIDYYKGGIMNLQIQDAVYNILDEREGYWEEGINFVSYRMNGMDIAILKDIFEAWLDNFMAGAMNMVDDMKERKEMK